ncbi:MAG: exodeoxyribonuclease III [Gammaproteobacteria bacterium]
MKIATWNVNSLRVRLGHILDWATVQEPDVICLQETKSKDENFPTDELQEAGYASVYSGQPAYNGVAILSKSPVSDTLIGIPDYDDSQRRVIATTVTGVRVINLYIPNGQYVGSDKFHYKLEWLQALTRWLQKELAISQCLVVTGDFNIAPEDVDVHDPEAWRDKILCSEDERSAFSKLLDLGLKDCFRLFEQAPNTFSWWDYRAGGFRRNHGLRIDHILANDAFAATCTACNIDREPRMWERPSDHAPVIAEFSAK